MLVIIFQALAQDVVEKITRAHGENKRNVESNTRRHKKAKTTSGQEIFKDKKNKNVESECECEICVRYVLFQGSIYVCV